MEGCVYLAAVSKSRTGIFFSLSFFFHSACLVFFHCMVSALRFVSIRGMSKKKEKEMEEHTKRGNAYNLREYLSLFSCIIFPGRSKVPD